MRGDLEPTRREVLVSVLAATAIRPVRAQGGLPTLSVGPGVAFLMLRRGDASPQLRPTSINHGCMSMDGFSVERIQKALENRGGAQGGTPELYFTDPDGLLMQLQDAIYCGGGGYPGNLCLPVVG